MNTDDVVIDADSSEGEDMDIEETEERIDAKATKLKQELDKVKKEKQEYLDGWQRAKADYVNALKRFEEEKKGAVELGKVITVGAFLPVMDSLERASAAGEIPESFQGIVKQLETAAHALVLEKIGEVGEVFNPTFHEALGQDDTNDASKDDTVTAVLETGWKSKEMVIRPAKVRVAHLKL